MQQFKANKCMQWNRLRVKAPHRRIWKCKLTRCRMNTKHIQPNITIQINCSNSKQINIYNGIQARLSLATDTTANANLLAAESIQSTFNQT